jgi:threonine dehydratase
VVAASTGNHAAAVAYAAQQLGTGPVDVMCPAGTSWAKLAAMQRFGATAHPDYDSLPAALDAAQAAGREPGARFVHPYDDELVIAGQGTIGVEIAAQLREQGLADGTVTVHAPGGGGGVASGTATAIAKCLPSAAVYVNQSCGADGILAELEGRPISHFDAAVDGAAVSQPGKLAMQVISDSRYVTEVTSHTNGAVGEAMAVLGRVHEVPEPAEALGMAGALQYMRDHPRHPSDQKSHVIVAITSGTVVTPEKVREFMAAARDEKTLTDPEVSETYSKAYGERSITGVDEVLLRSLGVAALSKLYVLSGPTA